jgi:hypothetical protein
MFPRHAACGDGNLLSMATELVWTAFLRVKTEEKANKLLFRLQETLGVEMYVSELGRYWKDDALFRCVFTTPLVAATHGDALSEGLHLAGSLAPSWEITNLIEPERLSGWARRGIAVPGIDALGFDFMSTRGSR